MKKKIDEEIIKILGGRSHFVQGDVACAYGSLVGGCRFFAAYPITPASEIGEKMSELLPLAGGTFIQTEDELASLAAAVGASWTGTKAMTATSGPGLSLMQENIGFAAMTETPVVIVDVQRVGPSTGMPTLPSQGDLMASKWGSHGDYEIICLAPSRVQETFDLSIESFNLAERYRNPVVLLMDEVVGHMREKLQIPGRVEIEERVPVTIDVNEYKPFRAGYTHAGSKVPEMDKLGDEYPTFVTGLTHDEMGYPATSTAKVHQGLVNRICEKITDETEEISLYEEYKVEDAEVVVISYGISARVSHPAVDMAREQGVKAGLLKMVTVWPFNMEKLSNLSERVNKIVVVEMNRGQMVHLVREAAKGKCEVEFCGKIGGEIFKPREILKKLLEDREE